MQVRYFEKRPGAWHLDFWVDGKRKRPFGGVTEAEAKKNAPTVIARALGSEQAQTGQPFAAPNAPVQGTIPARGGPTMQEAYDLGMRTRKSWMQSKDKRTLRQTFGQLGVPTDFPVAGLTRDKVRALLAMWLQEPGKRKDTKLSPSTVNHRLSMLSALLEVADLPPHGVKHLSVRGNERTRRALAHEIAAIQSWLLANAVRKGALALADLITVALETGAREGELLGIQPGDLLGDTVTFRDTKNRGTRTVPLPPASQRILEARKALPGGPFGELGNRQLGVLWNEAKAACGITDDEFVFHLLRHEAASRMAEAGVQDFVMAAILGHESLVTTKRYTHTNQQAMRDAQQAVAQRALLQTVPQQGRMQ